MEHRPPQPLTTGSLRCALLENANWESREAVDYPEDLGALGAVEPSLDWYSDFERFTPSSDGQSGEGVSLRISGHNVGIDDLRGQLPGIELQEHGEGDTGLLVGSGRDGGPSSVVAKPVSDTYTLLLLSYGLDVDDLVRVTSEIRPACEQEWVDAGGQILDCVPAEPDCIAGS